MSQAVKPRPGASFFAFFLHRSLHLSFTSLQPRLILSTPTLSLSDASSWKRQQTPSGDGHDAENMSFGLRWQEGLRPEEWCAHSPAKVRPTFILSPPADGMTKHIL